jgi:branched-chain amino acid aminotransferase
MGIKVPYSKKEINDACKNIINVQKVMNGYVRPVIWRGSEMMAISAQKNKIHVAIATWEWGSYFDPKLKLNGIKLEISNFMPFNFSFGSKYDPHSHVAIAT